MPIAERAPETGAEDTENIDGNIDNLSKKFIQPIDKIRSISRPATSQPASKSKTPGGGIIKDDFKGLQVNLRPLESRAHAFYRMLGFPVVGANDDFYNPGFDPFGAKSSLDHQKVNSSISSALQVLMNQRETSPEELRQVFLKQDLAASIYALLLRYPLPFSVLAEGTGPLEVDAQFFTVSDRNSEAILFANFNEQLSDQILAIYSRFVGARHILRPFTVDPRIENTVTPDINKICVPFLKDKKATKIDAETFIMRPGLELILRERLSNQPVDKNFLEDVKKLIANQTSSSVDLSTIDRQSLQNDLEALSDDNKISGETQDIFTNFTSIQVTTVTTLVKTIKAVIKKLNEAMMVIDNAKVQINWIPVPSTDGPGTGPIGASLSRSGANNSISEIDSQITELRIKKLNAERQIIARKNLGDFASPFGGNSSNEDSKLYNDQLQEKIQKRDRIANEALKAMGIIETITGEIAGLGLIDILCIYTALWAIDMEVLINFLDEDSFQRMYNFNPEFRGIKEVSDRFSSGPQVSITDAISKFESKLTNLLTFSDKLLKNQLSSPLEDIGGSVE